MSSAYFNTYSHGITAIDTGYQYPHYDNAYLVVENGRAAFIDTGVNASVPRLLAALDQQGLTPEDVDWVLLTHIHLDHAGGAGSLMAQLPNARLGVHARGVRHMIDPTQLMSAVIAVYGEETARAEYGTLVPIPAERIETLGEGSEIQLSGRTFSIMDSPGHARHHICIWDAHSAAWFTGDAFGLCPPVFRTASGHCILPSTTPSQFDPVAYHTTVHKLLASQPRAVFPTHSGEVLHPERLAPYLLAQIDAMVEVAERGGADTDGAPLLEESFAQIYTHSLLSQGWQGSVSELKSLMGIDLGLNVEGVKIWLDQLQKPSAAKN